jgi:hypothetical protein
MQENYRMLSIASTVFKVLAWIGLVLGIISAVVIFLGVDDSGTPRWMGAITLIAGAMYFFIFFIMAEVMRLLLDMNERIK